MRRHYRDDQRALVERIGKTVERDETVRLDRNGDDVKPLAPQRGGAFEHAFVLGRQRDDTVARWSVALAPGLRVGAGEMRRALQREIVCLGRPRGEDDLARVGADQTGDILARPLDRGAGLLAVNMALTVRIAELF